MNFLNEDRLLSPLLQIKNDIIVDASNEFVILTGYFKKELLGKTYKEINNMLKIDSQIYLEKIEDEYKCLFYLNFTEHF